MATRTIGLTGRDYSTLAAWASYASALSLAANEIAEFYNDGGPVADTTTVTIGGWTANGFNVIMRPASGQGIRHNANKLTNALRYNASNGAALTNNIQFADAYVLSGANLVIEDLQFQTSHVSANSVIRGGGGAQVSRCIFYRPSGGTLYNQAANITLRDSLLLHGTSGNAVSVVGDSIDIDNCTLAGLSSGGIGIQQTYTQSIPPRVRNTAFQGFTTAAQGTYRSGSTNNATTTASWTGAGISGTTSIADTEWENVTSGTEDFRLRSTASATMKTGGASGVGSGLDVVATTRGSTNRSIGAWEAASTGTNGTASGVTFLVTASLIVGTAFAGTGATAPGVTYTPVASIVAGSAAGNAGGTLQFQAAGMEFGRRTGLGISTFALDASQAYRYTVHADGLVLGAALITSSVINTDAAGKLPNLTSGSLFAGTTYRIVAVRQADGEAATFRMVAA